jgi:hypothetical protein
MSRTWMTIYVQFSLPQEDRETLDDFLRNRGTSLGQEFRGVLQECLVMAGIDPQALAGFEGLADREEGSDEVRHRAP